MLFCEFLLTTDLNPFHYRVPVSNCTRGIPCRNSSNNKQSVKGMISSCQERNSSHPGQVNQVNSIYD